MFLFFLALQLALSASVFATTVAADLATATKQLTFDFSHQSVAHIDVDAFHASVMIEKLTIVAEGYHDKAELRSLLNLPEGMVASREQISHAISCLAKKKKFTKLTLLYAGTAAGMQLTFVLETAWTLSRLYLKGSLMGKERYRQHYAVQPGEWFDEKKHQGGVEAMQLALAAEGYCNATVTDTISYDQPTKTVTVTLHIDLKKQFVIRDVVMHVEAPDEDACAVRGQATSLMKHMLLRSNYAKELLDRAAQRLHEFLSSKGFFANTITLEEEIHRGQAAVRLIFKITLHQKSVVEFCGNSFFSNDQLLEQIRLFGKSVTLIPPSLIAEEFRDLYHKVGFWDAAITWHEDEGRTIFSIKEGARVKISDVVIHGATSIPEKALRRHYKPLLAARYFEEPLVKQALDAMGEQYVQEGFWDCAVSSCEYVPLGNQQYRLVVTIAEGKQRFLSGVTIEDPVVRDMDSACIKRYAQLVSPIPFDIRILQQQKEELIKALHAVGRLYARPHPELVEEAAGTRLVWKCVGSDEVVTFGDTIIMGNSALPAQVISRELLYKQGDVWNQKKIERSVARLKKLGIFDSVTLAPEDLTSAEPSKTLLLTYIEDFPYEVRARLGIQGVNRNIVQFNAEGISYKAGGSFLAKNPFNIGDCFCFDLDFSRYMYDIVASYKLPWLWRWPIRTELKGYSSHYDQPFVIGSAKVLYTAIQDGFLCGFSKEYAWCDTDVNIGCEWLEIKPGDGCGKKQEQLSRAIFLNPRLIDHKYPYIFLQPTLFRSSLDNKIQPTRGALSLLSCKAMLAPTFSRAAFFKLLLEQSFFVPWGPLVFAWRGRCGTIFNAHFQNINPIERFYLGGAYSVRSYEPDLAPPLNPFRDGQGCWHLVATGGRSMFNMNTELRFPLYGSLSGVVFNDVGILSDHCIQAAIKEHAVVNALGFGLRFNTVVGPLRFDIGWKLNRQQFPSGVQAERPYAWFLALGNAF